MQQKQHDMSWRQWLLLLAAPLFLLSFGFVRSCRAPSASAYKRYVSPRLPDGTRYTFLYPQQFSQVYVQTEGVVILAPRADTMVSRALDVIGNHGQSGYIIVNHLRSTGTTISDRSQPQIGRLEANKLVMSRRGILVAPDGKCAYILQHGGPTAAPEQFAARNSVIMPSFRLLPRSAPVPSP